MKINLIFFLLLVQTYVVSATYTTYSTTEWSTDGGSSSCEPCGPGTSDDIVVNHDISGETQSSGTYSGNITVNSGGHIKFDVPTFSGNVNLVGTGHLTSAGDAIFNATSYFRAPSGSTLTVGSNLTFNAGCDFVTYNGSTVDVTSNITVDASATIYIHGDLDSGSWITVNGSIKGTGTLIFVAGVINNGDVNGD